MSGSRHGTGRVNEFGFELELCSHLERQREGIVARQLGGSVADPGGRILDVVVVEPGPEFENRPPLTAATIPDAALESDVGTGRARYWKSCFDCHPKRARRAVDRALEIGFFESERRNGREYVRQVARYPDWYGGLLGIENKPDLGRPGDLEAQLRLDVSLALVDRVVLATESYVTRAHLNRIPDEVGVWRVHRRERDPSETGTPADEAGQRKGENALEPSAIDIEVIREPVRLSTHEAGIEPLECHPGRTDVAVVSPESKARARRRIAERAYGKGWRTYDFPDCGRCVPLQSAGGTLPACTWAGRIVDPGSECGRECPGYQPADGPMIDLFAERERETAWIERPADKRRRQSGLDRFG